MLAVTICENRIEFFVLGVVREIGVRSRNFYFMSKNEFLLKPIVVPPIPKKYISKLTFVFFCILKKYISASNNACDKRDTLNYFVFNT